MAFVDDHDRVADAPLEMVVGFAVNCSVGNGATATVTLWVLLPPLPEQVSEKVVEAVSAPVLADPLVARAPLQPPLAVHVVALVLDQFSVAAAPLMTVPGAAVSVTDGGTPVPTGRTSIAFTHASPVRRVKTRLRVESEVTTKVRSPTVLTGTT